MGVRKQMERGRAEERRRSRLRPEIFRRQLAVRVMPLVGSIDRLASRHDRVKTTRARSEHAVDPGLVAVTSNTFVCWS